MFEYTAYFKNIYQRIMLGLECMGTKATSFTKER